MGNKLRKEWLIMMQASKLRILIAALALVLVASLIPAGAGPMASAGDVIYNGGFENGFVYNPGCGGMVGAGWGCFTNGGTAVYGFYDDQWDRVVYAGLHSQLIEINTLEKGGDNDRNAGIFQTVRVVPGAQYELALKGMIRADDHGGDPWRYRVYVGFDYSGGSNWQSVSDWRELPWDTYYPRTEPGSFSSYSTQVTPSGQNLTVFVRTQRRWGTWYEETDFNLDAISLYGPAHVAPVPLPHPIKPVVVPPVHVAPPVPVEPPIYVAPPVPVEPPIYVAPPVAVTPPVQVCTGANLVMNGGFENGFAANGVGFYWSGFTNGGQANYGFYDEMWPPVVSEGKHSQLLEINSIGLPATDPDRMIGIMQRVWLQPGVTYEISFDAAMREQPVATDEDPYRYMVEWGYSTTGTTDPAQMLFRERMPLDTILPRTEPGEEAMQRYSTRFVAPAGGYTTIAIWGLKKWATLERELDVNIDNVVLQACGSATVYPPVVHPPVVKPPVVYPPVVKPPVVYPPVGKPGTCSVVYTVQRGDTLSGIAAHFGTTVSAIMAANNLTNPNLIYAGQKLCIPGQPVATPYGTAAATAGYAAPAEPVVVAPVVVEPATAHATAYVAAQGDDNVHRVQRGDTLSAIAARHGTTVAALMQSNNLSDPNFIYVGQRIRLS
jgi:LysM repeat protein